MNGPWIIIFTKQSYNYLISWDTSDVYKEVKSKKSVSFKNIEQILQERSRRKQ